MTDYSSWKVADLKSELKNRGIPQTGLRLKQQIIDKLLEEDDKAQPEGNGVASESEPQPQAEEARESEAEQAPVPETAPAAQESQPEPTPEEPQEKPATQEEPTPTRVEEKPEDETATESQVDVEKPVEEEKTIEDVEMKQATAPEEKVEAQPAEEVSEEAAEPTKDAEPSMPPLPQTSEANTGFSTPLPIEEALEDKRKRKRRSQSPVPTPEAIANKKARAQGASPDVLMEEDREVSTQEKDIVESTEEQSAPAAKQAPSGPHKDARFRGLFAPTRPAADKISPPPPAGDITMEDAEVEPALHPATAALYIDGLMRPMQPQALRNHLVSLATAPGSEPSPSVVQDFFLDSIKTHCFAGFADLAAASRVRAALHNTIWPNERNRKILRADFIPEDQIKEWIQTEESSRNRSGPPVRWEVRYESTEDGMRAILAESEGVNPRAAPPRTREAGFNRTPPLGPRGSATQAQAQVDRRQSNAPLAPPSRPGQGFKPLDEIFESTTTKPKLYYKRVPRKVADKRLDQFDELLTKGSFPRRGGDEMRRITFEDDDYFVDVGPEYGPRAMQRRQGRGGRPGGGGGGGGGRRRDN
ncbi:hypothetical protein N7494_001980 [Penicillium frequentans]|uniref:SAP domain-containing protein n=1 Tax=Penicillium frequentans TaxID=3151616 RepID=A0AAD6D2S7_9EURO|nr:hypothetical protein N7494_001980 [Penicillium glabrum]